MLSADTLAMLEPEEQRRARIAAACSRCDAARRGAMRDLVVQLLWCPDCDRARSWWQEPPPIARVEP